MGPFAEDVNVCKILPKNVEMDMEEHRCKIVATAMEDSRCMSSLNIGLFDVEDPRYIGLQHRVVIEIDDGRCNRVTIGMEDPRCQNLRMKW